MCVVKIVSPKKCTAAGTIDDEMGGGETGLCADGLSIKGFDGLAVFRLDLSPPKFERGGEFSSINSKGRRQDFEVFDLFE